MAAAEVGPVAAQQPAPSGTAPMRAGVPIAPKLNVPSVLLAEPASEFAIPIEVGPPEAIPANSFVRLRGLPAAIALSDGHAIAPGSWAVPLYGLAKLRATVPAGLSGRSELTVALFGVDGTVIAEAKSALVIGPMALIAPGEKSSEPPRLRAGTAMIAPAQPQPQPQQAPASQGERTAAIDPRPATPAPPSPQVAPPQATAPPAPVARPAATPPPAAAAKGEQQTRAERLIAQGERFLAQGDIAIARQYFLRAAEAGLAQGALKLGQTYDPRELARIGAQGVKADRDEARRWYEEAQRLGAPEAAAKLKQLAGG